MTGKKVTAKRNTKTGSYTVRVPRSAKTGKFVSTTKKPGSIKVAPRRASSF